MQSSLYAKIEPRYIRKLFSRIKSSTSSFTSYRLRPSFKSSLLSSVTLQQNTNCQADGEDILLQNNAEDLISESSSSSENDALSRYFSRGVQSFRGKYLDR